MRSNPQTETENDVVPSPNIATPLNQITPTPISTGAILMNTTEPAAPSIFDIVTPIIDRYNREIAESDEAYYAENPEEERVPSPLFTLQDVMTAFAIGIDDRSYTSWHSMVDVICDIKNAIAEAINEKAKLDVWPDLTREHLRLLIGDRRNSRNCPHELRWAVDDASMGEPMTISLRLSAVKHRAWLEKDFDKRSAKLEKAKATVRALEGRAA